MFMLLRAASDLVLVTDVFFTGHHRVDLAQDRQNSLPLLHTHLLKYNSKYCKTAMIREWIGMTEKLKLWQASTYTNYFCLKKK